METTSDRKIILGILRKMSVDFTTKINKDRAIKKMSRAIDKGVKLPDKLTQEEKDVLKQFGFKIKSKEKPKAPKGGGSKTGALTYFKEQWKVRDEWGRTDIVATLKKMFGDKAQWAAANYISMAKKDKKFLGTLLTEEKEEDGTKILRKA